MQKVLTHTDLAANNKVFRLQTAIRSRIDFFLKRYRWLTQESIIKPSYRKCFEEEISYMRELLKRAEGVGFNYKLYREGEGTLAEAMEQDEEYLSIYREVKSWGDRKQHFEDVMFLVEEAETFQSEFAENYLHNMSESAKKACIQRMNHRLFIQMNEAFEKGWGIIFATLTVNAWNYERIFYTGSDAWRNYSRSVERHVRRHCFGSYRNGKGEDCYHVCGVVEEGGKNERLHIHALIFVKGCGFSDPTRGGLKPTERVIRELSRYWPWGNSQHIAVRFDRNDYWGQRNWYWPKLENGEPIEPTILEKMKSYMLKYLTKAQKIQIKGDTTSWKIRANHQMGKNTIKYILTKMGMEELLALTVFKVYPIPILTYGEKCPTKLIRAQAVKELLKRCTRETQIKSLLSEKNTVLKKLLQNMTVERLEDNYARIGSLILEIVSNADISKEYIPDLLRAKSIIEQAMPAPHYRIRG